jgi:CheY-like chemotaxis protein
MPGMSGLELAKRIYELRPDLPLVITTGFGGDLITPAQLAELPNIRRVVDKPLSSESIMRLIAELLRPGTPGGPDKA